MGAGGPGNQPRALAAAGLWPRSQLLGPNWIRLPRHGGEATRVAITIDDGPDPEVTPQVLSQLAEYRATATFFCVGERVERYPDLAQEIVRRGHAIENHSQRHRHNFSLLGPRGMSAEISRAQDSIFEGHRQRAAFFSRAGGAAQSLSRPGVGAPATAARELDAARLRYRQRQCRCRLPALGDAAAARRHLAAARRQCGAQPHAGSPVILEVLPRLLDALAESRLAARHPALGASAHEAAAAQDLHGDQLHRPRRGGDPGQRCCEQRSGLSHCDFETVDIDTHIGEVPGVDDAAAAAELRQFDCRNNRLAELALQQDGFFEAVQRAAERWGRQRIGVFIGTSTAGILQTELAYRERDPVSGALPASFEYGSTHNSFSVADYMRRRCGLRGSGRGGFLRLRVQRQGVRLRAAHDRGRPHRRGPGGRRGLVVSDHPVRISLPAALLGGSLPPVRCGARRHLHRRGGGLRAARTRTGRLDDDAVLLLGVGESSDAYHMSAPHPEGLGARRAMQAALMAAALEPGDIDYINLHGTGTPSNDRSESQAVTSVFGPTTPCSSTKGATGHTLGAAGALEAVISATRPRDMD